MYMNNDLYLLDTYTWAKWKVFLQKANEMIAISTGLL